jgi:periplasmic divalent cation tolerance protein
VNVVLCNCSPDESARLGRALVEEGLAACVNVLPGVTSYYTWEGAVQADTEHTLLIKVAADRVAALSDRIRALHSYDVPEIVVLDVDVAASDPAYVAWVREASGA